MHYFVVGRVVGRGVTPRSERGVADGEDASASPRTASICGCVCDVSGREERVLCVVIQFFQYIPVFIQAFHCAPFVL